jgi:hypothetical protein
MSPTAQQLTYSVPGMSCAHCRAAIDEAGYEVATPSSDASRRTLIPFI